MAEEMRDGFQNLSPIPASGSGNSGFRCEVRELLKEIAEDRFSFFCWIEQGWIEKTEEPDGSTRRGKKIGSRCHG
jgi:hypothetical protein